MYIYKRRFLCYAWLLIVTRTSVRELKKTSYMCVCTAGKTERVRRARTDARTQENSKRPVVAEIFFSFFLT